MKYLISHDRTVLDLIAADFHDEYAPYLKTDPKDVLERVYESSVAMSVLMVESDVKAFCLHRAMKCEDPLNPPTYLAETPLEFREMLAAERRNVITVEWMTVPKRHRGKFTRVQPADLIAGVTINFMGLSTFDSLMGYSRRDQKIDELTTRFGTRIYGAVDKFGIECSIMLVRDTEIERHPIARTQDLIDQLVRDRSNELKHLERRHAA